MPSIAAQGSAVPVVPGYVAYYTTPQCQWFYILFRERCILRVTLTASRSSTYSLIHGTEMMPLRCYLTCYYRPMITVPIWLCFATWLMAYYRPMTSLVPYVLYFVLFSYGFGWFSTSISWIVSNIVYSLVTIELFISGRVILGRSVYSHVPEM